MERYLKALTYNSSHDWAAHRSDRTIAELRRPVANAFSTKVFQVNPRLAQARISAANDSTAARAWIATQTVREFLLIPRR